jgi:N6-adenosine-specific RNA methylase IME4
VAGKFRTIVVDPPWDHEGLSLAGRGDPEYEVMSQEEFLALPVVKWSDENCRLYLWVTDNFPRPFLGFPRGDPSLHPQINPL